MENDVTQILKAVKAGRRDATDALLPIVYQELRQLAASKLKKEVTNHTLQPTALVHEAYLRLLGSIDDNWENRAHFFGAAAEAMRRILIDHARARKSQKKGGDANRISLQSIGELSFEKADDLIALDDALKELSRVDKEKAELVKLRFFVGLNMQQVAETLGVSLRTAERSWAFARAWIYRQMKAD